VTSLRCFVGPEGDITTCEPGEPQGRQQLGLRP